MGLEILKGYSYAFHPIIFAPIGPMLMKAKQKSLKSKSKIVSENNGLEIW